MFKKRPIIHVSNNIFDKQKIFVYRLDSIKVKLSIFGYTYILFVSAISNTLMKISLVPPSYGRL